MSYHESRRVPCTNLSSGRVKRLGFGVQGLALSTLPTDGAEAFEAQLLPGSQDCVEPEFAGLLELLAPGMLLLGNHLQRGCSRQTLDMRIQIAKSACLATFVLHQVHLLESCCRLLLADAHRLPLQEGLPGAFGRSRNNPGIALRPLKTTIFASLPRAILLIVFFFIT